MEDARLQTALARAMLYAAGVAASQPKAPAPVQHHFVPSAPVPPPPPVATTEELPGWDMRHGLGQQDGFVPVTTEEQPGYDMGGFQQPATTQEQPAYDMPHGFDLQGGFQQPVGQGGYASEWAHDGQQGANAGHVEPGGYVGQGGDAQQTGAPPEVEQASAPTPVDVKEEDEPPNGWTDNQGRYWSRDTHNPLVWWNLDDVHGWSRWKQPVAG